MPDRSLPVTELASSVPWPGLRCVPWLGLDLGVVLPGVSAWDKARKARFRQGSRRSGFE